MHLTSLLRPRKKDKYLRRNVVMNFQDDHSTLNNLNATLAGLDSISPSPLTRLKNTLKNSLPGGRLSINLVSYRKSKKPKKEENLLARISNKIDWFLEDLIESPDDFAYKSIAMFHLMTSKSREMTEYTLSMMHKVNDKRSEFEKLKTLEDQEARAMSKMKKSIKDQNLLQMDDGYDPDDHKVDPRFVHKTHCSIASFSAFISRFQAYLFVLVKRIISQTKRTGLLKMETDELEFFIERSQVALDDITTINISLKNAIETPTLGRLKHAASKSWGDLALAASPDAEKMLTTDFVNGLIEVSYI